MTYLLNAVEQSYENGHIGGPLAHSLAIIRSNPSSDGIISLGFYNAMRNVSVNLAWLSLAYKYWKRKQTIRARAHRRRRLLWTYHSAIR